MSEARAFLEHLDPTTDKFLFMTFDNVPGRSSHELTRTFYGTYDTYADELMRLNKLGAGVYVTINRTMANRRRLEDFTAARAIWQEDDKDHWPELANKLFPSMCIETSVGHTHRYWFLSPFEEDLPRWGRVQAEMVKRHGSDPGAKDLARILRLPGYYNYKREVPESVHITFPGDGAEVARYTIEEIECALGIAEQQDPQDQEADTPTDNTDQILEYLAQIQRGEHLHTPIRAMMMIYANKGFDRAFNKLQCQLALNAWPRDADPERYRKAAADLDAMLDATYRKISEEQEIEIPGLFDDEEPQERVMPWPPGLIGELAKQANDFFVVPNQTAAIMTALSLVAGIVGRRYNVSSGGLNLYTTIMMPTGAGKDSIRKFCQRVLMDKSMLGTNGLSFLGPQNFTGPAALLKSLAKQPSMLCIMTEAGLLYKTDSGDRTGLTRVILQAYTSSGQYEFIETEKYSNDKDDIPMVRAPALTIINEATPITLLGELKKRESINTGELPRMWIFLLASKKPYNNPKPHQLDLPAPLARRVKELLTDCYTCQNPGAPSVVDLEMPPQFSDFANWCTDQYNDNIDIAPNTAVMYTRAAHKVLKAAAVVSVFNSDGTCRPEITDEAWSWAVELFKFEMHQVDPIINQNDVMSEAVSHAGHIILSLLHGRYTSKNMFVPIELRRQGIFLESPFRQAAHNVASIRDLGVSPKYGHPKSGARVLLDYMVAEGYLSTPKTGVKFNILEVKRGRPTSKEYRITQLFSTRFGTTPD